MAQAEQVQSVSELQKVIRDITCFIQKTSSSPQNVFNYFQPILTECINAYDFEQLKSDLVTPESKQFITHFKTWIDNFEKAKYDLEAVLLNITELEDFAKKVKQIETVPELLEFIQDVICLCRVL